MRILDWARLNCFNALIIPRDLSIFVRLLWRLIVGNIIQKNTDFVVKNLFCRKKGRFFWLKNIFFSLKAVFYEYEAISN